MIEILCRRHIIAGASRADTRDADFQYLLTDYREQLREGIRENLLCRYDVRPDAIYTDGDCAFAFVFTVMISKRDYDVLKLKHPTSGNLLRLYHEQYKEFVPDELYYEKVWSAPPHLQCMSSRVL